MNNKTMNHILQMFFSKNIRGCPVSAESLFEQGFTHPTALVHETAEVDEHAIIGQNVVVGPNCVIGKAIISDFTIMGADNRVEDHVIIGKSGRIGDKNTIKENVVFEPSGTVGNENTLEADSHFSRCTTIGNNCSVGEQVFTADRAILADGVELPEGHVVKLRQRVTVESLEEAAALTQNPALLDMNHNGDGDTQCDDK